MSCLKLFFLGPPRLEMDGLPLEFDTRKAIALMAYLALTGESHSRDALATLFWAEYDQSQARANLRRTLAALTKAIGKTWLDVDREAIHLLQSDRLWLDVVRFRQLLAECQAHAHAAEEVCPACLPLLTQALELYRADFMAGFTLRDSPAFDEWQFFQTESLRREVAEALKKLAQSYGERGEFEPAITYARRWVALDPVDELAQRWLMQLYAWAGQRNAAIRQYQEFTRVLAEELGVSPQEETGVLYQAIQENRLSPPVNDRKQESGQETQQDLTPTDAVVTVSGAEFAVPISLAPAVPLNNLPAQTTTFVGREEELKELTALLASPSCRLLTLVGLGGIGKTRLAVELASVQQEMFSDGVCFVPLAAVGDMASVVRALANALNFNLYASGDPKVQLINYLREKSLLLILDNMEHLLDGIGFLSEMLQGAPAIKLLVTSRERLNLQGEWVFEVPGLSVPPAKQTGELEAYGAVALFVQSARRVQTGFELNEADRAAVVRICRLVEGIPLGIELAAAWVRLLSCEEIAQEIERNLDFLTVTARDIPERHRSLRAAFDHSWKLLAAEESLALGQLSVFQGGFRRKAAEKVTGVTLPVLATLVDKFLIRRLEDGRYELHELVRQYAATQLQANPDELTKTRQRHSSYYLSLLQQNEAQLKGPQQKEIIAALSAEIGNLRLAWDWASAHGETANMRQSMRALFWFFEVRCWFQEAMAFFEQALTRLKAQPTEFCDETDRPDPADVDHLTCLGQTMALYGYFCFRQGQSNEAKTLLNESLALHEQVRDILKQSLSLLQPVNDQATLADMYLYSGIVSHMMGEYAEGRHYLEQSLAIHQALADHWSVAHCLGHLGIVAYAAGEYQAGQRFFQESLKEWRLVGDPHGIAFCLSFYGLLSTQLAEYDQAQTMLTESLTVSSANGDRWGIATALNHLGLIALAREPAELAEAQYLFRESVALFREMGALWNMARALNHLGQAAYALAAYGEAKQAFTEALQISMTAPLYPVALDALVGLAPLLALEGASVQAFELIGHILTHPASGQQTRDQAEQLRGELEARLSPQQVETARESEDNRSFEIAVAEILERVIQLRRLKSPK